MFTVATVDSAVRGRMISLERTGSISARIRARIPWSTDGVVVVVVSSEEDSLHRACAVDSRSAVIPSLLAHPDIDVNLKTSGGSTPFFLACLNGHTSCVREMLKDSRVKVNERRNDGWTPLYRAAWNGSLDIIKW